MNTSLRRNYDLSDVPPEDFGRVPLDALLESASKARTSDVIAMLGQEPLGLEAIVTILRAPKEDTITSDLFARARAATLRAFDRDIHLFAPCYISSFCENACRYCAFDLATPAGRRWLSPPRVLEDVRHLAAQHLQRIVLVAGESPYLSTREDIARMVLAARPHVAEIDLNVGAASQEDYQAWHASGASGIVCFQETYQRDIYEQVHPSGPKGDYAFRLGALERAARAGMQRLGTGVLLGLADPARELVYLILHIRHLAQRFPAVQISVSLPRIARTSHPTLARFVVDEEDLLRHVAILRLAVPFASIEISTREPAWLRERLIYVGANAMSVDASMRPEAWVECQHDGGDLQSGDVRNVSELLWDLEDLGCNVRWTAPVRWPGPRLRARPRRTAH